MARKQIQYVKIRRKALAGEMVFHEEAVALSSALPPMKYPQVLTAAEKENIISDAIRKGFTVGVTVVRPHHSHLRGKDLRYLAGTIVGFDRADPKWEYAPILVKWGDPTGNQMAFGYKAADLELLAYSWENECPN